MAGRFIVNRRDWQGRWSAGRTRVVVADNADHAAQVAPEVRGVGLYWDTPAAGEWLGWIPGAARPIVAVHTDTPGERARQGLPLDGPAIVLEVAR